MMNLLKENEDNRKNNTIQLIVGIILGILSFLFLFGITSEGMHALVWFIDLPSLLGIILICAAVVLCSGVRGKKEVFLVVQKAVIPAGIFMALTAGIIILGGLDSIEYLGPNLAVAILSMAYAVLIYLILIPVNKRLEK